MNPEVIEVILKSEDADTDVIEFHISDASLSVNLNSPNSQVSMKAVFAALLKELVARDIELQLTIDDDFNRVMYKEVCTEYISDLNRELSQVKDALRNELRKE